MDNINNVEEMTDKQFMEYKETLLKLVLERLENSKTLEEAKEKIAKRYEEKSNKEIKAVLKDYEQIIKPEMVEFNADINKLVDLAYMEGRNGNIIENNYTIISRYFNKKNLEISYNFNS